MRYLFIFLLFPFCSIAQSPEEIAGVLAKQEFSKKNIYLFCRGTKAKSGLIARNFNRADTSVTHVGIGFYDGESFRIFNVTDSRGYLNALLVDSVTSFIAGWDVYYFSIWECSNSPGEFQEFKQVLETYATRKIIFDVSFRLKNDDTLYCSEFCAGVLNKINTRKFYFEPVKKKLDDKLFAAILEREAIIYYPIDFFTGNKKCKKIFESGIGR
ncbi:MAG: hypothetical protein ABIR30_03215 [Chitinophagaceae bacterium]